MRRPVPFAAASAALMIPLGLPFLGIKFTGVDATVLPASHARVVDEALPTDFPPNARARSMSPREAPTRPRPVERYARELGDAARVAAAAGAARATALRGSTRRAAGRRSDERAQERCATCARSTRPSPVRVGGAPPAFLDQQRRWRDSLPLALGILAATTLVILFLMTGSVVLPIKALLMNVLTLSAAFAPWC